MTETYVQLKRALQRYMSEPIVETMLAVALRRAKIAPETLQPRHLENIYQELGHGIRLFCPPEKVPQMMLELAALAE